MQGFVAALCADSNGTKHLTVGDPAQPFLAISVPVTV